MTPGEDFELVHAVTRPVEIPRPTMLNVRRAQGDTSANLMGALDVYGPSTERLDVEASWTEQVDDITADLPAGPVVRSVLPLFRWGEATEPDQPFVCAAAAGPGCGSTSNGLVLLGRR